MYIKRINFKYVGTFTVGVGAMAARFSGMLTPLLSLLVMFSPYLIFRISIFRIIWNVIFTACESDINRFPFFSCHRILLTSNCPPLYSEHLQYYLQCWPCFYLKPWTSKCPKRWRRVSTLAWETQAIEPFSTFVVAGAQMSQKKSPKNLMYPSRLKTLFVPLQI